LKIKFPVHIVKTYGNLEAWLHSFLGLDGDEWSVQRPGRSFQANNIRYALCRRLGV